MGANATPDPGNASTCRNSYVGPVVEPFDFVTSWVHSDWTGPDDRNCIYDGGCFRAEGAVVSCVCRGFDVEFVVSHFDCYYSITV